jgi:hypothetical protein
MPDANAEGQMFLGSEEDGFVRPLKETDERYLKVVRVSQNTAASIISLQEEIKEIKKDALDPVKGDLTRCAVKLDALERLYAYNKIRELCEKARIESLEEEEPYIVYVVSPKITKFSDWVFTAIRHSFVRTCEALGTLNVFKVAEYCDGELVAEDEPNLAAPREGAA